MCLYIYDRTIQSWTDDIDTYIYIRTFKQSPYLSEDIVSVIIFYRKKIFPNIMIDLNRLQTCELAIQYTPCSGHLRSLGDRARHQGLKLLHAGGFLSSFPQ